MPNDETRASVASRIEAAIRTKALTLDEICLAVFNQKTEPNKAAVRLHLYRLDARGALDKTPRKYKLKA